MSGEKRSQDCEDTLLAETTIIVDIEGTTTSISFVKDTLFPYVRDNLKKYIEKNWEVEEFKGDLEKLKEQAKKDETDKVEGVVAITGATPEEERESVVKNVLWQMDGDRKTAALKQLQGHMWREAYETGTKGHVYDDVPKAFDAWTKSGRKIYVYSSGSVAAQKLLFGHSVHGDMLKYFTGFFDTDVGAKQEASSYKNILAKIDVEPTNVLFLTDVVKEAQAAKEAGISVNIVIRPGNAPLTDEEKVTFTTIESFMDLSFQTSAKRQKVEKADEKVIVDEPAVAASEPMDTSEEVPETSAEKVVEKPEEPKKTPEVVKAEETKIPEKSEVTSMETESKVETEKKSDEVVAEKPTAEVVESKKTEEESKSQEKKSSSEVPAEVTTGVETAEAKKECESTKKEADSVASEQPMDEDKNDVPSKSEPIATTTEDKTEVSAKSTETATKSEQKTETEAKIVESTPDSSKTNKSDAVETPSSTEVTSNVVPESKVEKTTEEKVATTSVEKAEPAQVVQETTEKIAAKVEEKPAAKVEEVAKRNGDSAPAKVEDTPAVDKTESNGSKTDSKTEVAKADEAAAEKTVAAEKKAPVAQETEKKIEPTVETAKKEEKQPETEKTKIDEKPTEENADAKLNGTTEDPEKDKEDKPHRNGLNGDSLNEKSNGGTNDEASAQNGEAESSSGAAAAESIKTTKKVVDSTIADGAGEPDVVAPVAVAATS